MRAAPLVAVVLALVGCSTPQPAASGTASPAPTASVSVTASPAATQAADVYFVGDTGTRMVLYRESVELPASADLALTALRYLTASGTQAQDTDYSNLWGNGTTVNGITYDGKTATVDLTLQPLNVGSEAEMRAIDQLVWTLTANHPSIEQVRFTSGGAVVESFAGHVDTTGAFAREHDYDVLAPIWVDTPPDPVASPVVVTGTACTFEAVVAWELSKGGTVVRTGSTVAAQACPVRSPWSVDLGTLAPGEYVFRAIDYSAKDGSVNQADTKRLVVK